MINVKPGINIKKHRKLKGLTQKELASLIGKSEISVRKYEADNPVPSLDVLQKIASALSVEVAELQGIDTVYTVYSKLNVLNESQAEVEPKILETRSLINELISREHLTDIEKRKLDNYKTNLRSYSEQYLFVVREKANLQKNLIIYCKSMLKLIVRIRKNFTPMWKKLLKNLSGYFRNM